MSSRDAKLLYYKSYLPERTSINKRTVDPNLNRHATNRQWRFALVSPSCIRLYPPSFLFPPAASMIESTRFALNVASDTPLSQGWGSRHMPASA